MAIVDYKKKAEQCKKNFFADEKISKKNKEEVRKFLDQYDVSHARESIFFRHIAIILRKIPNIRASLEDRDLVNKSFKELRTERSVSYYATIINVTLRFVRWLNDDEKPKGYKDIKNIKKSLQLRDLKPGDMITWEEGLQISKQTNSMQIRSAFLLQLDAGFRPSEFIDLKYGDVTIKDNLVVFSVKGKTGSRNVWIHRSVPHFLKWYEAHPTKRKNDPLWLIEDMSKSNRKNKGDFIAYSYQAMQKRIRVIMERSKIDKPCDFYNLRHSSCVLDKIDNVPEELGANRHGHSIAYYTGTYGRLNVEGVLNRVNSHYGKDKNENLLVENINCSRCHHINEPNIKVCSRCNFPLTVEEASKLQVESEELKNTMQDMKSFISMFNEKPIFKKALEDYKKKIERGQ